MATREPVYCNRLVRGPHGETIFLKANALPPAEHITNELHRRATKSARDVLSNGKRFGDHAAMNASSETIDDAAVKEEFMASSANPWKARYSPYVGKGFVTYRSSCYAHQPLDTTTCSLRDARLTSFKTESRASGA
jgi:hypothetical protein